MATINDLTLRSLAGNDATLMINVKLSKGLMFRMWLAIKLITLAAWIVGLKSEVTFEPRVPDSSREADSSLPDEEEE